MKVLYYTVREGCHCDTYIDLNFGSLLKYNYLKYCLDNVYLLNIFKVALTESLFVFLANFDHRKLLGI